ncbi:hypothetical protein Tco_0597364 [Tanacetum coccineum]
MSKEEEVLFLEIAKGRDKIFRGDGRFKESIMILSEMLEDFDSLDVEDYTDLVKNRYKDEVWEDQLEYSCKLEDYMIFFVSTFADGGKWFIGSLVGSTETKIVRKISSTVGKKTRRGGISRNVDDLKDNHKFRGGLLGINLHNDLILPTPDMGVVTYHDFEQVIILRMLKLGRVASETTIGLCFLVFSILLTPMCYDDIHDVVPRVSALAGYDRLVSEPLVIEK